MMVMMMMMMMLMIYNDDGDYNAGDDICCKDCNDDADDVK